MMRDSFRMILIVREDSAELLESATLISKTPRLADAIAKEVELGTTSIAATDYFDLGNSR